MAPGGVSEPRPETALVCEPGFRVRKILVKTPGPCSSSVAFLCPMVSKSVQLKGHWARLHEIVLKGSQVDHLEGALVSTRGYLKCPVSDVAG